MVHGDAKEVGCGGRRGGRTLGRPAEEQLELGPDGAELVGRREREVDLQLAREEKDAVEARLVRHVEERDGAKLALDLGRPGREHMSHGGSRRHAEGEIEIGPAVAGTRRQRSHLGTGHDAGVGARFGKQTLADRVALGNREQRLGYSLVMTAPCRDCAMGLAAHAAALDPVRATRSFQVSALASPSTRVMVMQPSTGQTSEHRLQPTHSCSSTTGVSRVPGMTGSMHWWAPSSQAMWHRLQWMHLSGSMRATTL